MGVDPAGPGGWVLAVDFGTSNTGAAARFADGRVEKVKLGSATDTMPSAVVLTTSAGAGPDAAQEKQWRVGQAALNARRTAPGTFVGSPKSRLGQEPALFGDDLVSPAQMVSHVLAAVRRRAISAAGGTEPVQVVLTHPVGWPRARLDALCQAAVLAGFDPNQVFLLPEPVAAFHAHTTTSDMGPGSRVAVVDIGGGTCDVAVVETTPTGGLVVVAQAGDDRLGGNDLDDLVFGWVTDQLTLSGRGHLVDALDAPENLGDVLTLLDTVSAAKQDLSEYSTAPVAVAAGGMQTVVTITRDEYEDLIADHMARTATLLTRALHDSQTTTLRGLLLTGGTAHTPALARALHQITGIMARPLGDPKLAVATGALRTPPHLLTHPATAPGPPRPAAQPGPPPPARHVPGPVPSAAPPAPLPSPGATGATPAGAVPASPGTSPPPPAEAVPALPGGSGPATLEPAVTVLAGRYELGEVIGNGAVALVYRGRDQLLGRQVAIKVPHTPLAEDPDFVLRFSRGASMAGRLNHPSIVRVYDIDTAQVPGKDGAAVTVPFMVMELVSGHPLTQLIPDGQPLPVDQALGIAADLLTALEFSHQAGIVHRDVKPGNVMLTTAGTVKVMDFAIARPAADTGTTTTKGVLGTPAYLSPEQVMGHKADTRSDLYSAGCLLFEMLTGRPPFVGRTTVATAYAHINDPSPPPTTVNPHLPPVLDEVLAKALAKDRDNRYQDAGTFRADLEAVRRDPTRRPPGLGYPEQSAVLTTPSPQPGGPPLTGAQPPAAPPPPPVTTTPTPVTTTPPPVSSTPPSPVTGTPAPARQSSHTPPHAVGQVAPTTPRRSVGLRVVVVVALVLVVAAVTALVTLQG
ncbi:MAG: protein kinase [Micrococcales bacterium]|nr:protein kinase [Micrococcales bacterium]MCL2667524.1 protein kinase [Micrococcales bacterium]